MRIRPLRFTAATFAIAALAFAGSTHAAIVTTFDASAEGWTGNEANPIVTFIGSGGSPGGFLEVADNPAIEAPTFGVLAPAAYHGDLTEFIGGVLSFEAIALSDITGPEVPSFGTVTIAGPAGSASIDLAADEPQSDWTLYSRSLTAAMWGVDQATWEAILADVNRIEVQLEYAQGVDVAGFDNFAVTGGFIIPEPSTVAILAGPALLMLRRRR